LAILISNAGGDNYDEFLEGYRAAFETELPDLENFMRIRNALAQKAKDEAKDEAAKK